MLDSSKTNFSPTDVVTVVLLDTAPDAKVATAFADIVAVDAAVAPDVLTLIADALAVAVEADSASPLAVNPPIAVTDPDALIDAAASLTRDAVAEVVAADVETAGSTSTPNESEPYVFVPKE